MNIGLLVEGHSDSPSASFGIQGDRTFHVHKTRSFTDDGGRQGSDGWAIGLGGQIDYLVVDHGADRVRPLAEASVGYLTKYKASKGFKDRDGASIKAFVQQDLTRSDTYVGGRLTLVDKTSSKGFPAISFQFSQRLRDHSWHSGIGLGFAL